MPKNPPKETKKEKEPKIKAFFRRNKKLAIIISIAAFLLLVFGVFRVWLGFHFLITDDLILNLEPKDKPLYIHHSEKPNVTFSAEIENSFFCDASCSYEFEDVSAEYVIDRGAFSTKGLEKNFRKTFQLSAARAGSGQKIYVFNIECHNIRSGYCPTNEDKRKRLSFVTLNYDLSDYEKMLKINLKDNITKLSEEMSDIDIKIQELNNMSSELGLYVNLKGMETGRESLNRDYDAAKNEFKNLEKLWPGQNYQLISEIFNNIYDVGIPTIRKKISELNSGITNIVERHNSIILELNRIDGSLRSMDETLLFLGRAGNWLINSHKQLLGRLSQSKLLMQPDNSADYDFFDNELIEINKSMDSFAKESAMQFMHAYLSGAYYANLEKSILCGIKGICINKNDFPAELARSIGVEDSKIGSLCASFGLIKEYHHKENNKSQELMKGYSLNEVSGIIENAKNKKILIAKNNISNEINGINPDRDISIPLSILLNLSKADINFSGEINYGEFQENEILSLMQLNLSGSSAEYYSTYCSKGPFNLTDYYGNMTRLEQLNPEDFKKGDFSPGVSITLAEDYPLCCVFKICKRCCTRERCGEDPSLYPILFLHGHAYNKKDSPDFSLDAFNKIQAKLQEDDYLSAGTITPTSDYSGLKEGEWGMLPMPISVKGTYYMISYYNLSGYSLAAQQSENIETYAIRLKELIDLLKFRTGRDKVIIIAHSMGSLVARSYMQIFGDSSVDKLIMLGSPNKGVYGKVSNYCPILGEKKECNDMSANSIFIKKLNDPLKIPKKAKIYNIIGVGCSMGNETGDGIIFRKNAELEYAKNYYINGTCTGISSLLHTQMLDIEEYPEVYDSIKRVLKERQ